MRTGYVQPFGRPGQATGLVDRLDRAQMAEFQMHVRLDDLLEDYEFVLHRPGETREQRKEGSPMTTISFEFFPPKSIQASFRLWDTIRALIVFTRPSSR